MVRALSTRPSLQHAVIYTTQNSLSDLILITSLGLGQYRSPLDSTHDKIRPGFQATTEHLRRITDWGPTGTRLGPDWGPTGARLGPAGPHWEPQDPL
jgi:hypothetical protein